MAIATNRELGVWDVVLLRESFLPRRRFSAEHHDLLIDYSSILAFLQSRCVLVPSSPLGSSRLHLGEVRRLQFIHGRINHQLATLLDYLHLLRAQFFVDVFELGPIHVEGSDLAGVVGEGTDLFLNALGVSQVFHVQLHVRELGGRVSGLHILIVCSRSMMLIELLLIPTRLTQM